MWWLLIPILTGLYTGISVMLNTSDYCSFGGDRVGRHGVLFVEVGVPPAEGMPCTQVGGLLVAGSLGLGLLLLLYAAWRVGALDAVFPRGGPSERATPWEVATQNPRSTPAPPSSAEARAILSLLQTARSHFFFDFKHKITDADLKRHAEGAAEHLPEMLDSNTYVDPSAKTYYCLRRYFEHRRLDSQTDAVIRRALDRKWEMSPSLWSKQETLQLAPPPRPSHRAEVISLRKMLGFGMEGRDLVTPKEKDEIAEEAATRTAALYDRFGDVWIHPAVRSYCSLDDLYRSRTLGGEAAALVAATLRYIHEWIPTSHTPVPLPGPLPPPPDTREAGEPR